MHYFQRAIQFLNRHHHIHLQFRQQFLQEYLQWLLTDANIDLTDLIEDIRLGKSQEQLIENIRFIKATLNQYMKEVYPAPPEEDE